jgi:hypothetical protein
MRLFYYVHTGHRIGLDRFRRAAAILNELADLDITLLCSDYRIAGEARKYGIKRALGLDLIRNIPQIAHHGDKIIVDSAELNPTLHEDMSQFFSTFIRISDDPSDARLEKEFLISPYLEDEKTCKGIVVDPKYEEQLPKTIPMALFFGDDDYEKDLEKYQNLFAPLQMDLLMGFYHFLGYENTLRDSFKTIYDSDDYDEVIRHTDRLVTASAMAVLQNLASGGRPIYVQRPDYTRDFIPLFEAMGIPIVDGFNKEQLMEIINNKLSNNYHNYQKSNKKISEFIRKALIL